MDIYSKLLNTQVLIRAPGSGVFIGTLSAIDPGDGKSVALLTDYRRIWRWEGALDITDVATHGITGGKVSRLGSCVIIPDAREICMLSDAARNSIVAHEGYAK